jgi:hypothetical protein
VNKTSFCPLGGSWFFFCVKGKEAKENRLIPWLDTELGFWGAEGFLVRWDFSWR